MTKLMFCLTIVYLEENYKIKEFFKKILTQKIRNLFFGSKTGGQLIHGKYGKLGSFISQGWLTLKEHCLVVN